MRLSPLGITTEAQRTQRTQRGDLKTGHPRKPMDSNPWAFEIVSFNSRRIPQTLDLSELTPDLNKVKVRVACQENQTHCTMFSTRLMINTPMTHCTNGWLSTGVR